MSVYNLMKNNAGALILHDWLSRIPVKVKYTINPQDAVAKKFEKNLDTIQI